MWCYDCDRYWTVTCWKEQHRIGYGGGELPWTVQDEEDWHWKRRMSGKEPTQIAMELSVSE